MHGDQRPALGAEAGHRRRSARVGGFKAVQPSYRGHERQWQRCAHGRGRTFDLRQPVLSRTAPCGDVIIDDEDHTLLGDLASRPVGGTGGGHGASDRFAHMGCHLTQKGQLSGIETARTAAMQAEEAPRRIGDTQRHPYFVAHAERRHDLRPPGASGPLPIRCLVEGGDGLRRGRKSREAVDIWRDSELVVEEERSGSGERFVREGGTEQQRLGITCRHEGRLKAHQLPELVQHASPQHAQIVACAVAGSHDTTHGISMPRRWHGPKATTIPSSWDGGEGVRVAKWPYEQPQRTRRHRGRRGHLPHLDLCPLGAPRGHHVQPVPGVGG